MNHALYTWMGVVKCGGKPVVISKYLCSNHKFEDPAYGRINEQGWDGVRVFIDFQSSRAVKSGKEVQG